MAAFIPTTVETVIVEEVRLGVGTESHTPSTCAESNNFNLIGPKWNSFPVKYTIDVSKAPADVQAGAAAAIVAGFEVWEGHVLTITTNFFQNVASSQNKVSFRNIDGPGNILAQTRLFSHGGFFTRFTITLDSSDNWELLSGDTCPTPDGGIGFDVQNVAAHEAGHVVGLHHSTQDPGNEALTMYPFILALGETYKRSPGLGDITGMQTLY